MLKNKVIVVIGGLGLIGFEFVKSIIKNHGIAIIADINYKKYNFIIDELNAISDSTSYEFYKLNLSSAGNISNCIEYVTSKYNKIDALVNTAYPKNKDYGKDFFDVTLDSFNENINLNLGGYFLAMQIFCKYFLIQGYGNIINVGSIYGSVNPKFEIYKKTKFTVPIEYTAVKSALIHITKYVAKYFSGKNIRVNLISPGGVFDDQPNIFVTKYRKNCLNKGLLDKSDMSGTLIFLLSDDSKYINGQNIIVDDGFSL